MQVFTINIEKPAFVTLLSNIHAGRKRNNKVLDIFVSPVMDQILHRIAELSPILGELLMAEIRLSQILEVCGGGYTFHEKILKDHHFYLFKGFFRAVSEVKNWENIDKLMLDLKTEWEIFLNCELVQDDEHILLYYPKTKEGLVLHSTVYTHSTINISTVSSSMDKELFVKDSVTILTRYVDKSTRKAWIEIAPEPLSLSCSHKLCFVEQSYSGGAVREEKLWYQNHRWGMGIPTVTRNHKVSYHSDLHSIYESAHGERCYIHVKIETCMKGIYAFPPCSPPEEPEAHSLLCFRPQGYYLMHIDVELDHDYLRQRVRYMYCRAKPKELVWDFSSAHGEKWRRVDVIDRGNDLRDSKSYSNQSCFKDDIKYERLPTAELEPFAPFSQQSGHWLVRLRTPMKYLPFLSVSEWIPTDMPSKLKPLFATLNH